MNSYCCDAVTDLGLRGLNLCLCMLNRRNANQAYRQSIHSFISIADVAYYLIIRRILLSPLPIRLAVLVALIIVMRIKCICLTVISVGVLWPIVIIICVYQWKRWVASRSIAFISFSFTGVPSLGLFTAFSIHEVCGCLIDVHPALLLGCVDVIHLSLCGVNHCVTIAYLSEDVHSFSSFRSPVWYFAHIRSLLTCYWCFAFRWGW